MSINRDQLLTDQAHRREAIETGTQKILEACEKFGLPMSEESAGISARELLAKIFDAPELNDTGRFPA